MQPRSAFNPQPHFDPLGRASHALGAYNRIQPVPRQNIPGQNTAPNQPNRLGQQALHHFNEPGGAAQSFHNQRNHNTFGTGTTPMRNPFRR